MKFERLAEISPDGARSLAKIMSGCEHKSNADKGIQWLKQQAEQWEEIAIFAKTRMDNQMLIECTEYARVFKEAYEIAIAERI